MRTVEDIRRGDWIQTSTGRRFWPCDPRPEEVDIEDIAHALGNQCRFTGHTRKFYSVAQHCFLVSFVCEPEDALWGLLHDASEAYLADVARPVKRSAGFGEYRRLEDAVQLAVCKRFGLAPEMPKSVHRADQVLLHTERRDLMPELASLDGWDKGNCVAEPLRMPIDPWTPSVAAWRFMGRFLDLTNAAQATHERASPKRLPAL